MERNESNLDRIIRGVAGTFLLWAVSRPFAAGGSRLVRAAVGLTGSILLFTAVTGYCGVYDVLNISTAED
jgi:hypothetical protein